MAFFQQAKFKENSEAARRREGARRTVALDTQFLTARAHPHATGVHTYLKRDSDKFWFGGESLRGRSGARGGPVRAARPGRSTRAAGGPVWARAPRHTLARLHVRAHAHGHVMRGAWG